MVELDPITPNEAVQLYLDHRQREVSKATLQSHKSRLNHFLLWCDEEDIDNLNDLSGRDLHEYRLWRRNFRGGIRAVTEKTQMDTFRVFIRFVESVDGVREGLSERVLSPDLDADENVRDTMLEHQQAEAVLDYLSKFRYASRAHVILALMWHTSMRRGAIRALDVEDYHSEDQYLEVRHRPDTDTPIKNKESGERTVGLSPDLCAIIDDWVDHHRPDVSDEFGRDPLVSTSSGRLHRTSPTTIVYANTRPCKVGQPCPINRDPDDCEASYYNQASKCPESVSSHEVRRGSITHHLKSDIPVEVVSARANVGREVLGKHYDQRSERDKMEQRRKYLHNL